MRKFLLLTCAAVCLAGVPLAATAGSFNAQGQFVGSVSPQVKALLAQFPTGGPALTAAVALLLETDPTLAQDVVFAARSLPSSLREAVGKGIAHAARFFALCAAVPTETCRAAEAALRQAMLFADPVTIAGYSETAGPDVAADITRPPPIYIPGIGGVYCVSPSSPSGC